MILKNPEIKKILNNIKKNFFLSKINLNNNFFKKFSDERVIEVPYLLSRYNNQNKILEVGLSLADLGLVQALLYLKKIAKVKLYAFDLVNIKNTLSRFKGIDIKKNFEFHQVDIRKFKTKEKFDFISLISTLEHVGFDEINTSRNIKGSFLRKKKISKVKNNNNDFIAIKNLAKILNDKGSLIITLPFGNRQTIVSRDAYGLFAYFREYNLRRVLKLIQLSNLSLRDMQFYEFDKKWKKIYNYKKFNNSSYSIFEPVKSIVCLELKKIKK